MASDFDAAIRIAQAKSAVGSFTFFDTTPNAENNAAYGGAWNNYPYFKDGVVGISSISEGLYLVRPILPKK